MADTQPNWLLRITLLLLALCSGLAVLSILVVAFLIWFTLSNGRQYPVAQVIHDGCPMAMHYVAHDGALAAIGTELTIRAIEEDNGPIATEERAWLAASFGWVWPTEVAGCFGPDGPYEVAMNPPAFGRFWGLAFGLVADQEGGLDVAGYTFVDAPDAVFGMVDGTLLVASTAEGAELAIQRLQGGPADIPLRTDLQVQTDTHHVALDLSDDAVGRVQGTVHAEGPDQLRIHLTLSQTGASTRDPYKEAKRMCGELDELVAPAKATCTTRRAGQSAVMEATVSGVMEAIAARED